jgi:sterol 24-C-methyltransferase
MSTLDLSFFQQVQIAAFIGSAFYLYRNSDKLPTDLEEFKATDQRTQIAVGVALFFAGFQLLRFLYKLAFKTDPIGRTSDLMGKFSVQEKKRNINVNDFIDGYNTLHDDDKTSGDERNSAYSSLVNAYYELATLFYEWGWGQSFHFAYKQKGESFIESIKRHEYYLAGKLGVNKDDKVLDVGCGIGGPYRNIAPFLQANVTGVTLNEYQVNRANELNQQMNLSHRCKSVQGDFHHLPFEDESFNGAYAIEATCHAPVRENVFGEVYRVLKPGSVFAVYEWCLTDNYDPENEEHRFIKKKIEEGDGLPDMCHTSVIDRAMENVGFELLESRDLVYDDYEGGEVWYLPMTPSWNVLSQRFQFTGIGMGITTNLLKVLEAIGLAPAGTSKVQTMLQQAAIGLARGGETETFTPMYLCVGRKPFEDEE